MMSDDAERREAQEGFGEAGLGEAQSENPPVDPDMIDEGPSTPRPPGAAGEEEADESGGRSRDDETPPESAAGDQDAGPAYTPEQAEIDSRRDQAEG